MNASKCNPVIMAPKDKGEQDGGMKTLLFFLLVCVASALPPVALEVPANELSVRKAEFLNTHPGYFAKTITHDEKWGGGRSMLPMLHPGDVILFKPYHHEPVNGEVVLVQRSRFEIPTVHLCIDEVEHAVLTKGINNKLPDGYQSKAFVSGVLVAVLRAK